MRYWGPAGSRATIVNNYIWKVLAITSLFRWAGDGEISDKQQGVCATHRDQTFDTPKFWDPVYSHDVNIYHQHHYFSSSSTSSDKNCKTIKVSNPCTIHTGCCEKFKKCRHEKMDMGYWLIYHIVALEFLQINDITIISIYFYLLLFITISYHLSLCITTYYYIFIITITIITIYNRTCIFTSDDHHHL